MKNDEIILERECEYLEKNLDNFTRQYGQHTFFAIIGEEVVDHDQNMFDLAVRIDRHYGDIPVLITNVGDYVSQLSGKV